MQLPELRAGPFYLPSGWQFDCPASGSASVMVRVFSWEDSSPKKPCWTASAGTLHLALPSLLSRRSALRPHLSYAAAVLQPWLCCAGHPTDLYSDPEPWSWAPGLIPTCLISVDSSGHLGPRLNLTTVTRLIWAVRGWALAQIMITCIPDTIKNFHLYLVPCWAAYNLFQTAAGAFWQYV